MTEPGRASSEPAGWAGARGVPARCFVQASSRSWSGGPDLSVSVVDGAPAFARTVGAILAALPSVPVVVLAPEFDRSGSLPRLLVDHGHPDVAIVFGDAASPLRRMVEACADLPADSTVLRINGLNLFVDPRTVRAMCASMAADPVDCLKMHDDYPAVLALDLYRVGALRQALHELAAGSPLHVHPKYHLQHEPTYTTRCHPRELHYTDGELRAFRSTARQLQATDHQDVGERHAVSSGDQLRYHYELALRSIRRGSRVLDIACGPGYGVAMLATVAGEVIGGDIDEGALAVARERLAGIASVEVRWMDAQATGLPDDTVDHVTSFETLEHVDDIPRYLAELDRVLCPGGTAFISTPQNCHGHIPLTFWHRREYSAGELAAMLAERFEIEDFVGLKQGRVWFPGDRIGNNSFVVVRSRKA